MSDISIPGVNSKFNTQKMIDDLVKVETVKLTKMQDDLKVFDTQKKAWLDINRVMNTLRTSARAMFNFENPFTERAATSSDDSLTATASREAQEGTTRVKVVQLAQADRFASKPLAKDAAIPEGTYTFKLGDDSISLRYRGGDVRDFADALNRRADGRIKASIIQNAVDSSILLIESQKTGSAWPLNFADDAVKLGTTLGIIEQKKGAATQLSAAPENLTAISKPLESQKDAFVFAGDTLTVRPGGEAAIPITPGFALNTNMILEYQVRARTNPANAYKTPEAPNGPHLPPAPVASFKDVSIPDFLSTVPKIQSAPPTPPPVQTNNNFLSATVGAASKSLPEVADSQEFQTVRVPISQIGTGMSALAIRNTNSLRELDIKGIRVFDPTSSGDYGPSNPISRAQDAKIAIEGIEITRDTNTIKDAIPGVTLNLQAVTDKIANVKVEPDRKLVKDKIIEFVANYNAVLRQVNILTARVGTTDVVDEIDFLDDKQREEAVKNVGMYQGDTTLSLIKNRFQTTTANAYKTLDGNAMSMLAQAGISTNASAAGSAAPSSSRLRGYLEINEKQLDTALADHFLSVKDIFGSDTNGDLIADSGVGVELDKYIAPYVSTGGILASKTSSIDTLVKAKNTDISNYQQHLKDFEQNLKEKFGAMEGTLNQLDASSREIRSFGGNGNSNQ